jgi:recombinational DNA repair ATPase RecF
MRIETIRLAWFRGAADPVSLELASKSVVVYGANSSGKSSFVDAVEYVLKDGKISHLAHEYSGKRQEKAILNTHKPSDRKTELAIIFSDKSALAIEIQKDGTSKSSGAEATAMSTWDYQRTVLRQEEVAEFIRDTKGEKYSKLLPLLGLHPLEVAAENCRKLAKSIQEQAQLERIKTIMEEVEAKREATFGKDNDDQIMLKIGELHASYCTEKTTTQDAFSRCKELEKALDARIEGSTAEQRLHIALQDAAGCNVKGCIDAVRSANAELVSHIEPLIAEKLEVLRATATFVGKIGDEKEVECPACGRYLPVDAFQAHIESEQQRLHDIIVKFDTRKAAIGTLCNTVKSFKENLRKDHVELWRNDIVKGSLADNYAYLDGINVDSLRVSCGDETLKVLDDKLLPLHATVVSASRDAPPDAQKLSTDKKIIEVAETVITAKEQVVAAQRAESLVSFVKSLEQGIRDEIRLRSQKIINEITADIQTMWAILHPYKVIQDVRLHIPSDADKAIDVALKFHGVDQDSPRLTLSEGYRNSLGLCIFLAMAKREADKDRPVFLDDVVISLDRNHRGMIVELLEKEFGERQVVVLTHDREWYTEMRQQLDGKTWIFKVLLPYETPLIGIRWSDKTTTFDDARAQVKYRPDSGGNDARKIMDTELALIAERLQIRLPFLRGDRNDMRMAHEFLARLIADGKGCFKVRDGPDDVPYTEAIVACEEADRLLISWGNRASHSRDVVPPEATRLIDACEKTLDYFVKCPSCGKGVYIAKGSKWLQCECGRIRWVCG